MISKRITIFHNKKDSNTSDGRQSTRILDIFTVPYGTRAKDLCTGK